MIWNFFARTLRNNLVNNNQNSACRRTRYMKGNTENVLYDTPVLQKCSHIIGSYVHNQINCASIYVP